MTAFLDPATALSTLKVTGPSFESYLQWMDDVRRRATLDLETRSKQVFLDTKHYILRELTIRRYLKDAAVKKLQLGTGGNQLDGWLNTDFFPNDRRVAFLDATKKFPFEDQTFDYIFTEHQIEHITYPEGQFMLAECFRVLKSGGRIRIATPDLARLLSVYPKPEGMAQRYVEWITQKFIPEAPAPSPTFVVNCCMHLAGHRFVYDGPTLSEALSRVGFVGMERFEPSESRDPNLRGIDSHAVFTQDEDINRFESMIFEARRP